MDISLEKSPVNLRPTKYVPRIHHVRVAYEDWPPWVNAESGNATIPTGILVDFMEIIARSMEFNYTFLYNPDGQWGSRREDGTWSGMIGMLHRKEADVALGPFALSESRFQAIRYTTPVFTGPCTMIVGKIPIQEGGLSFYFKVLSWEGWLLLAISLLAVTSVASLVDRHMEPDSKMTFLTVWKGYFWLYMSYLLYQVPRFHGPMRGVRIQTSYRLVTAAWILMAVIVIMCSFRSLLISSRMVTTTRPVVRDLEDLLKNDKVIPLAARGTITMITFKESQTKLLLELWKKIQPHMFTMADVARDEYLDMVEKGTHVILSDNIAIISSLAGRYHRRKKCSFYVLDGFTTFHLSPIVSKFMPNDFYEEFNYRVSRLVETSAATHLYNPVMANYTLCLEHQEDFLAALNLQDITGMFIIWGFGVTVSLIIFLIEMKYGVVRSVYCRKKLWK